MAVRHAEAGDEVAIASVAREFEISGADSVINPACSALLRQQGRLVVAEARGEVVGFGGMIDIAGTAMVTDLFVLPAHHGQGLGTAMLDHLVQGYSFRMTFSSAHPAARAAYARAGMESRWVLRYLQGASPAVAEPLGTVAVPVPANELGTDRPELLGLLQGARLLQLRRDSEVVGHAIVHGDDQLVDVHRLQTTAEHVQAVQAVLSALPPGTSVRLAVPEISPAARHLAERGFAVSDQDLHMSSHPDLLRSTLVSLNPGLA